jgi:predicted dithiol-disulfide oxidoreductase (DUF899 family)
MAEHRIGTREEWRSAHQELVEQENELAEPARTAKPELGCADVDLPGDEQHVG